MKLLARPCRVHDLSGLSGVHFIVCSLLIGFRWLSDFPIETAQGSWLEWTGVDLAWFEYSVNSEACVLLLKRALRGGFFRREGVAEYTIATAVFGFVQNIICFLNEDR